MILVNQMTNLNKNHVKGGGSRYIYEEILKKILIIKLKTKVYKYETPL